MNKLTLSLEDLRIDSFSTDASEKPKGTMFGEQCTCWTQCDTCQASCNGTCDGASCGGTCDALCGTWDVSCGEYSCQVSCANYTGIPYAQQCYIC